MDKIKSMMHSGSKTHDEVPAGSAQSGDPLQSSSSSNPASGQGSHFGSSRTAGNDPITSSSHAPSSGYDASATGTHGLSEPHASRMPGSFDDDAATTASVKSGIAGSSQSNDPTLNTNKALPREPATAGSGLTGSLSNTHQGTGSTLTGTTLPDRSVGSSGYGVSTTNPSNLDTNRSFPLGGSTNSGSSDPYTGQSGTHGANTATAPHSSSLANKADPRVNVGSAGYGSGTGPIPGSENQGSLGRDSSLGASSGYGADSWKHGHGEHGHKYGGDPCEDQPPVPGPHMVPGPHATDTANRLDPHVSGGSGSMGTSSGGTGTLGLGSGHGNSTAPYSNPSGATTGQSSGRGYDSTSGSEIGGAAAPVHGSSGPTTGTSTGSGLGQTGGSGFGSSTSPTYDSSTTSSTGRHHHNDRDIASAGGAGAADLRAYEGDRHNERGQVPAVSGSTGPAPTTAGPHKSDLLNKLDPRVDSDLSKQKSTTGDVSSSSTGPHAGSSNTGTSGPYSSSTTSRDQGLPSTGRADPPLSSTTGRDQGLSSTGRSDPYSSSTPGRDHHYGRDAALAGTGGAAAYELEKGHGNHKPTGASSVSDSTNPYSSNLDPRVDSSVNPQGDSSRHGITGASTTSAAPGNSHTLGHANPDQPTGGNHHYGRDAAVAGTGGVGAYEAEKHLGSHGTTAQDRLAGSGHQPSGTGSAPTGQHPEGTHHYGRDAAAVGTGGVGAYEAEKHLGSHGTTAQDRLAGSGHQPSDMGSAPTGQQTHHYGRDAAAAGTGGVGAYEAEKHLGSHHGTTAQDQLAGTGRETSGHPGGYAAERGNTQEPYNTTGHSSHKGRDAALIGGAGAGAGALASHEYSEKEAEKLQKQQIKDEKQHDKTLAKEEKQHEKALAKDEKKHDKAIAAEEKKHDKHDGEKKHGGLMGLLHRDKPDKALKEEAAARQASHETDAYRAGDEQLSSGRGTSHGTDAYRAGGEQLSSGRGTVPQGMEHDGKAYSGGEDHQVGSPSGVRDSPISSGPTTHAAYGTDEGPNKLHKDPPAKVLESRGYQA